MKTYQPSKKDIKRNWHLVDAQNEILGRLSSKVALLLMGKHKANYSANIESGDYVVVINADKINLTGKKVFQKVYRSHSGYPGGFKEVTYATMFKAYPQRVIQKAVFGMLPDNRLKDIRMKRLKVVSGDKNPYQDKFKT